MDKSKKEELEDHIKLLKHRVTELEGNQKYVVDN